MPCNRHHASALRRAASLMHSGMLTPAEEVRSQMSDLLDDGLKKEGFSLSEVMSKVVTPAAGTEARSAVRVKRLDEDERTGSMACRSL